MSAQQLGEGYFFAFFRANTYMLHKRAARKSISEGISLNRLVRRALEKEVGT